MMRQLGVMLILAFTAVGCGAGADRETAANSQSTPSSTPTYVESSQCRSDAQPVLDILKLAMKDTDVRDVAGRLATIEKMMPQAVALCSGEVSRPTSEAIDNVSAAVDGAMAGQGGAAIGRHLTRAHQQVDAAEHALTEKR